MAHGPAAVLLLAALGAAQPVHNWWDSNALGHPLVFGYGGPGVSHFPTGAFPGHNPGHNAGHNPSHFAGAEQPFHSDELDTSLVGGRFKLQHHVYDGLDRVLDSYDVSKEDIEAIRSATIITTIDIDDDGEVSISTSDADSPEQSNTVSFTPGKAINITDPLNGETKEFIATVLSPTMLQTRSEGQDSVEVKTWTFRPEGAMVSTEVVKINQMFPITSEQIMVRVDADNKETALVLRWVPATRATDVEPTDLAFNARAAGAERQRQLR